MRRKIFFVIFVGFFFGSTTYPQFNYLPAQVDSHQEVYYIQFALSYNEEHEQAEWVVYELTKQEAQMEAGRSNDFRTDSNIMTGSATPEDYTNSGFDKGHLSPSEDNQLSEENNKESFLMSNMSPQLHRFNNGIWKELEEWVREKVLEFDTIYVVSGPVFLNNLGTIGENKVTIPGYFYKVLLRFDNGRPNTIAFLIPQVGPVGQLKHYIVPVNALETITGIDFFPALDDSEENSVESRDNSSQWGL